MTDTDFAEFYAQARDSCLSAVALSVRDPHLAEDLVEEAFVRSWVAWRTVSAHPNPRAWVVRTALNVHISWWRRRRREVVRETPPERVGPDPPAPMDEVVAAAVARLPRRQRQVLALRVFLDLDTAGTAEVLGIAAGTVTAHLHRALTALRTDLANTDLAIAGPLATTTEMRSSRERR